MDIVSNGSLEKHLDDNNSLRIITRDPIHIFDQRELLDQLKNRLPSGFKIGAAVGAGDCFFDAMAQRLNELKDKGLVTSSEKFNVKFLRESCKKYAQNKLQDDSSWLKKALSQETEDIAGYIPRIEFTARDIESANPSQLIEILKLKNAIWGRTEIEGKIICEEYKVKIEVIELRDQQIDGLRVTTGKIGADAGDSVVYIVNYMNHFVPLLNNIEKSIEESEKVSIEEVYGMDEKVYTNNPSLLKDIGICDLVAEGKSQTEGIGNIIRQEDQQLFHSGNRQLKVSVNSPVFYYDKFNKCDLESCGRYLKKKFNEIIKDLEENNSTSQGDIKLIKGDGNIEYFRAKLSDSDRLLFRNIKYNDKDAFVILEVILNHDYHKSKFLTNREKIKNIKIISEEVSDNGNKVDIEDSPQVHWLGKFVTFSATQEDIVKDVENYKLPLVISGAAGSGKTSVALESLKKMQEKFKERKILYITKSANLIKESKKFFECERYDGTTGESKTYIPEEIEFLSLHEFLERREEDIKGKRPIDRNKFFSWFSEICKKDKFKEYKKDGDKIFEEFTAVIAGRGLTKEQYKESGRRQAIFPEEKRDHVYGLFEKYKEFIGKDLEHYDANLIANQCNEKKVYDAVVIDEVQDLTKIVLDLILKSLKDESKGNFLLCGDVNQVIHPSFFSLSKLKSSLSNKYEKDQKLKLYNLEKNYRNSKQVIELANRILHFKNYCFAPEDKMTEEELFFMESDKENEGNIGFIPRGKEQEIAGKVSNSTKYAVLVLDDENKKEARKLFGTPLVFYIHEAKGLEFKNVILYKFTSHKAYNEIWNVVCPGKSQEEIDNTINKVRDSYNAKEVNTSRNKDKEDKSLEKYKFYINALYVGVTRAVSDIYIIDDKSNLLKIIEPEGRKIINIEDIKKEESTPEEWRDMALKLIDEGNIEQAKSIALDLIGKGNLELAKDIESALLNKGEKRYAQNIIDELKVKGYNAQGLQLSLDKDKQAISELKAESQKPSVDKLAASAEKTRKRRGKKLQQEKKSKELKLNNQLIKIILEDQLNEFIKTIKHRDYNKEFILYLTSEKNSCKIANYLIDQGADVDAKIDVGLAPLHSAVKNGFKDFAQLLLKHGADVDVRDSKNGFTPLHLAAKKGCFDLIELLLQHGAKIDTKSIEDFTPLHLAIQNGDEHVGKFLIQHGANLNDGNLSYTYLVLALNSESKIIDFLLADPNINVGCLQNDHVSSISKNRKSLEKFFCKLVQDRNLFNALEQVEKKVDENKIKKIEELLKPESKYGFKPSLNYSPDNNNTTAKIAINAGGKVLQLLYNYAKENIEADSEIFKQLKRAKENSQSSSRLNNASVANHFAQAQGFNYR